MARITVLGGTGYAGSAISREAASRGHEVTIFSRNSPLEQPAGNVVFVAGSALNPADLERVVADADVVVVALAPTGDLEGRFEQTNADIAAMVQKAGARLAIVGGGGSLTAPTGDCLVYETAEFPQQYAAFAKTSGAVLQMLRASDASLDWFVLSPPTGFGHWAPGVATGTFRVGGDVLLVDEAGRSAISGADFAAAFVNEIERPAHRRQRFTVAY